MNSIDKLAKALVDSTEIKEKKKTSAYDANAKVIKVEGNTAWVNIQGGIDQTPARMVVNARVGEEVRVRVANGNAYVTGNATSPPTDDSYAKKAEAQAIRATKAADIAVREAETAHRAADTAIKDAEIANTSANNAVRDAGIARQSAEQAVIDAETAAQAATNAETSASEAAEAASNAETSASNAETSASQAATSASNAARDASAAASSASSAQASATAAQNSASSAGENASRAQAASEAAQLAALSTITTDTIHYLATSQGSGVTRQTSGWTTTVQTMTATDKYLWTYHTYTSANGTTTDTDPVITGTFGEKGADGTSVTILGSYDTLADLQRAHPTGTRGDAYMVGADLYVWNGSAWEDVGQIQGPQGATGPQGPQGETGDDGVSVTAVQPQYYLSTSPSSATGGSWSATLSYVVGKYIWTRDYVTYSDNTHTTSTEIYNQALTQSCEDAAEALGIVEEQQEYFWHDTLGAHVLSDADDVTGVRYRTDIKGAGMDVKVLNTDGTEDSVATFGETARIGFEDGSRILIDEDSITGFNSTGNAVLDMALSGQQLDTQHVIPTNYKYSKTDGTTVTKDIVEIDECPSNFHVKCRIATVNGYVDSYLSLSRNTSKTGNIGSTTYQLTYSYNGSRSLSITFGNSTYSLVSVASVSYTTTDDTPYWSFGVRGEGGLGAYSCVFGQDNVASGAFSFATGKETQSTGNVSMAEGYKTVAAGEYSHVEGFSCATTDTASCAHAEGCNTHAEASYAHAEGYYTYATGYYSHAEGSSSHAYGYASHASGTNTIAGGNSQMVIGKYNIDSGGLFAFVIGNGDGPDSRSDALRVDWKGDIRMYLDSNGTSSADATSGTDKDLFNAIRALGWYSDVIV